MMVKPIMSEYPKCKDGIAAGQSQTWSFHWSMRWDALTILIAKAVFSPHTSRSVDSMNSVNKPIAAGQLSLRAFHGRVTEQSGRHTRPEGEYDKRQEIAHSECPSPCLI